MPKKKENLRAQSILDYVLAFIIIALLGVSVVRIWGWFNANYAHRQVAFQRSRLLAGNASPYEILKQRQHLDKYPMIDINATPTCLDCAYKPLRLTEEWLFKGQTAGMGTVRSSATGPPRPPPVPPEDFCRDRPEPEGCANPDSGCWQQGVFFEDCPCYIKCVCRKNMEYQSQQLHQQATGMRTFAGSLGEQIVMIGGQIAGCWDDPWSCQGSGTSKFNLMRQGSGLTRERDRLLRQASKLDAQAVAIQGCCDRPTPELQQECVEEIATPNCQEITGELKSEWRAQINESNIERIPAEIDRIGAVRYLIGCMWVDGCCQLFISAFGGSFCRRNCIIPPPPPWCDLCDSKTKIPNWKCSLTKLILFLGELISKLNTENENLTYKINHIDECCLRNNTTEKMKCIDNITMGNFTGGG
jgi:hypothetical protein